MRPDDARSRRPRGGLAGALAVALLAGCAAPPPPCPRPRALPDAAESARGVTPAPPPLVYLPAERTGGARDCLDPDSATARAALAAQPRPEAWIDAAPLALDVAEMRLLLQREYAGFAELAQAPRFDLDAFFDAWQRELETGPHQVTLERGVLARVATLKAVTGDRHLSLAGGFRWFRDHPELQVGELEATASGLDLARCETLDRAGEPRVIDDTLREVPVLGDDGALAPRLFLSARGAGDAVTLRCGDRDVRFARRPKASPPGDPPAYAFSSEGDAAVIVIGRMGGSPEDRAALEGLARDVERHKRSKLVVFDLRGDGGGSDRWVTRWVEAAARTRVAPPRMVLGASARVCGGWNQLIAQQIEDGVIDTPGARTTRDEVFARLAGRAGSAPALGQATRTFDAKEPYRGRVIVLVDRATASSAEGAALLLAQALDATIVGERTGGYFEFGEVVPFVMPRTGLVWEVPTKRFYPDRRIEGVGYPVDVVLAPELMRRSAKELLPLLRKLPIQRAAR